MVNEDDELRELTRKLDTNERLEWLPELSRGAEAFAWLVGELDAGELKPNQRRNALALLFRVRASGAPADVLRVLGTHLEDTDRRVRSTAATLAVGLVRLEPKLASKELSDRLNAARDLEPDAARLVAQFGSGH